MSPLFSIIIPVYNVAPYLRECLDSVLAQTFTDWEAICVDDGSSDGSGAILDEYGARDSRFVIVHQINAGVSAARNAGLDICRGEWICFLDGDDVFTAGTLEAYGVAIAANVSVDVFVFSGVCILRDGVKPEASGSFRVHKLGKDVGAYIWGRQAKKGFPFLRVLRKSCFELVRFPVGVEMMEDQYYLISILSMSAQWALVDAVVYGYRVRDGSASSIISLKRCVDVITTIRRLFEFGIEKLDAHGSCVNEFATSMAPVLNYYAEKLLTFENSPTLLKSVRECFQVEQIAKRQMLRKVVRFKMVILIKTGLRIGWHFIDRFDRMFVVLRSRLWRPATKLFSRVFCRLRTADNRDVLYLINNLGYEGGAHIATKRLIKALCAEGVSVDVLLEAKPTDEEKRSISPANTYCIPLDSTGIRRLVRGFLRRLGVEIMPAWAFDNGSTMRRLMEKYKCICIMSECSPLSKVVAGLPKGVRKVQLSHMDYVGLVSAFPGKRDIPIQAWRGMDVIAVVGRCNAEKFKMAYPQLADKVTWFTNIIPMLDQSDAIESVHNGIVRLITCARVDYAQKDTWRIARIAQRLKIAGLKFVWTVWGAGGPLDEIRAYVDNHGFGDVFRLPGWTITPHDEIRKADMFVLLSHYEGLPNVIYESFMCHTPVFSTDVGAIADQISSGENGWLVKDDEEAIFAELKRLISTPTQIYEARHRLDSYNYDNDAVVRRHIALVGVSHDE